jgi:hypothetical protein
MDVPGAPHKHDAHVCELDKEPAQAPAPRLHPPDLFRGEALIAPRAVKHRDVAFEHHALVRDLHVDAVVLLVKLETPDTVDRDPVAHRGVRLQQRPEGCME